MRDVTAESAASGLPVEEVAGRFAERSAQDGERRHTAHGGRRIDRRTFLRGAARAGALAVAWPALSPVARAAAAAGGDPQGKPRIVIVGAGLAGMTAAYRLGQAGLRSTVHEASDRVGGRTWTLRGFFDNDQFSEHGGEFINSDHHAIIGLARELGLSLTDLDAVTYPNPVHEFNYLNGHTYRWTQALLDFEQIYPKLHHDFKTAGYPAFWNQHTKAAAAFDRMSVAEWIDSSVPGGHRSDFGRLLDLAYVTEFGVNTGDQSALNLLYELGLSPRRHLKINGIQDYRYQIAGGNDGVVQALAERLPQGSVVVGSALAALRANPNGTLTCSFAEGGGTRDVTADRVILTLPFTALRNVDISRAGFAPRMQRAISRYGLGTNAKLHLQFRDRVWYADRSDGSAYADTGFQSTWETDITSPVPTGILVNYTGGKVGAGYGHAPAHGPARRDLVRRTLAQMEPAIPGVGGAWNGKAFLDFWAQDPWHQGSYSCFTVGQITEFGGYVKIRQGNVHFAGEHTSYEFQGYMNGGVVTGERAAREVRLSL